MLRPALCAALRRAAGLAGCGEGGAPPSPSPTTAEPPTLNSCHDGQMDLRFRVVNWATDRPRNYTVRWTVGGQEKVLTGAFTPEGRETAREEGPFTFPQAGRYEVAADADGVAERFEDALRCDGRVRLWATWDLDGWRFTTDNAVL